MDKYLEQEFSVENTKGEEIVQIVAENDFNDEKAEAVAKKLSNKETIRGAQRVLITWLEKGECNDRNSARFYSLIQLYYEYVKKQQLFAQEYLKKFKNAEKNLANSSCCMKLELDEVEQVFNTVEKPQVWDSFTEVQRKEIQRIKTEVLDSKKSIAGEVESSFIENVHCTENMELDVNNELNALQAQVGSLKSELVMVRQKTKDIKEIRNEFLNEIQQLRLELEKRKKDSSVVCSNQQKKPRVDAAVQCCLDVAVLKKMQIISLISTYLYDHPSGVGINDIYSHASKIVQSTTSDEIKNLLKESPQIFEFSKTDCEAEERWFLSMPPKPAEP